MSHPHLTNLPPPSPPTPSFLGPFEFSPPQTPKQKLSKRSDSKILPRAAVGQHSMMGSGFGARGPKGHSWPCLGLTVQPWASY